MKRLAFALLLVATPVFAQQQPSAYAPIVIDEATYKALRAQFDEVPFRHALPLVQWLEQAEMKARADALRKQVPAPAADATGKGGAEAN